MTELSQKDDPARRLLAIYPVQLDIRAVYSDMDAFRHVNSSALVRYFEEGRAEISRRVFGPNVLTDPPDGLQILFASLHVDYLAQAHYPTVIKVATGIKQIGKSSFRVAQALFQGDTCVSLAEVATVKARRGKPEPLTEQERSTLQSLALHAPE